MSKKNEGNFGFFMQSRFYEEGGNKPFYTGKIEVDGKEWELAAWFKVSDKTGSEYFSVKVSEPRQQGE